MKNKENPIPTNVYILLIKPSIIRPNEPKNVMRSEHIMQPLNQPEPLSYIYM